MNSFSARLRKLWTGYSKPVWLKYFLIIGLFYLLLSWLLVSPFSQSALVFILTPYLVGVFIYVFIPPPKGRSKWARFGRHMLSAIIVMLGTSVLLREGIICVAMFLPIYMFFAAIYYISAKPLPPDSEEAANVFKISIVPLLIITLSLEGVNATFSLDRDEAVTKTILVQGDIETIKSNLANPIYFDGERSLFLSLFPLPYDVQAGSFEQGEVHKMKFAYKRWIFTNTHYGETWVKLAEIGNNHVRTEIVRDSSYFSKYMTINGTLVEFKPVSETQTEVSLTIYYTRDLDPAWYFGPLQRRAIGESAEYIIEEVIAPNKALSEGQK